MNLVNPSVEYAVHFEKASGIHLKQISTCLRRTGWRITTFVAPLPQLEAALAHGYARMLKLCRQRN